MHRGHAWRNVLRRRCRRLRGDARREALRLEFIVELRCSAASDAPQRLPNEPGELHMRPAVAFLTAVLVNVVLWAAGFFMIWLLLK